MDEFDGIYVSELMKMGVEELRSRGIKDLENFTAEHLGKLRALINGCGESRGLDLAAVNEKLCKLNEADFTNPRPRRSLSATPDASDPAIIEQDRQDYLRRENEAYRNLIQDGGQPSHCPSETTFDFLYDPETRTDIVTYWITICHKVETILEQQEWIWKKFREHQDWRRSRYWRPEWFNKFAQEVKDYTLKKGLLGDICLLQDRKKQSRLDDWKEFQYWQHKKADQLTKEIDYYAREVKVEEAMLQKAIDEDLSAEEIGCIRDYSLAAMYGHHGSAKIELQRQNILLKWIDEQVPIIAIECETMAAKKQISNSCNTVKSSTSLGKRKREADETGQNKQSRRKVESARLSRSKSFSVNEAEIRLSRSIRAKTI